MMILLVLQRKSCGQFHVSVVVPAVIQRDDASKGRRGHSCQAVVKTIMIVVDIVVHDDDDDDDDWIVGYCSSMGCQHYDDVEVMEDDEDNMLSSLALCRVVAFVLCAVRPRASQEAVPDRRTDGRRHEINNTRPSAERRQNEIFFALPPLAWWNAVKRFQSACFYCQNDETKKKPRVLRYPTTHEQHTNDVTYPPQKLSCCHYLLG